VNKTNTGHNLIFLISQPRAGSTMLQRMLGSHPQVHTTSEPWLMLHPLYSMKTSGIDTEYSSELALNGLVDFLSQIENGETVYREKIREMYASLYGVLLEPTGKSFYLDKTPRYYFIIKELHELLPDAKFIILLRNPLAVLASIVETWTKTDWFRLSEYKNDLLRGPDFLLEGLDVLGGNALKVIYENLLNQPENQIKQICQYIGIDYDTSMLTYGESDLPRWDYGDQQTVYEKTSPDSFHAEKWVESLANPQIWRALKDYLVFLGKDRLETLGYSYNKSNETLEKHKPNITIEKKTTSFFVLLDNTRDAAIERAHLKEQLHQKDQQIQNIYSSYTYCLGNMLLLPIRKIIRIFKK
jgi:hypothetical protein